VDILFWRIGCTQYLLFLLFFAGACKAEIRSNAATLCFFHTQTLYSICCFSKNLACILSPQALCQCRKSLPCKLHARTSTLCHAKQAVLEWKQSLFVCVLNRAEPCPSGNQPLLLNLTDLLWCFAATLWFSWRPSEVRSDSNYYVLFSCRWALQRPSLGGYQNIVKGHCPKSPLVTSQDNRKTLLRLLRGPQLT